MSKYMDEFKEFISKGNVMDMAVGVIIGGAFTAIVTSLTDNIINPLITAITGGGTDMSGSLVVPGTSIDFGAFLSAIINFLIVAFIVFNLVKAVNHLQAKIIKTEPEPEPAPAPTCPHCLEEVKEGATRCPHCAGEIPGGAKVA
ncbi:MAG: large conductance mechanosensitive channel protein MscL [Atopobiaceae bacterium]|nr:large conductance mechanosensitive channel protein MscL [Atopobiaceae bacterium]